MAKSAKSTGDRVVEFVVDVGTSFLTALALMVGVGALHSWIHAVPPVGYWTTYGVGFGVASLIGMAGRSWRGQTVSESSETAGNR